MGSNTGLADFELLYQRWSGPLHHYACYLVRDTEAARSLVNDLFIQLWHRASEPENLKVYLYRSIKNAALNYISAQRSKPLVFMENEELTTISDLSAPKVSTGETERLLFLQKLIGQLPERRQLVFRMHRLEGFSYAEIAELMQISVRTVEDHLSKSMQFLHSHAQQYLHAKLTEA